MIAPGTLLHDRYRVLHPLGQGRAGAVYVAMDERLAVQVALKALRATDEAQRRQIERESRLLARLHHPALPAVLDYFAEGESQFLVMRFVGEDDLAARLAAQAGGLAPAQVVAWGSQLLGALALLHRHEPPILHRAIRPQNLKLTARGDVVLVDFGLAPDTLHAASSPYAAPELLEGAADPRSDLYALAATLYHLLTGSPPPNARTRAEAVEAEQPDPLRPAHLVQEEAPAALGQLLGEALALEPAARPPSAVAMKRRLDAILPTNPHHARPTDGATQTLPTLPAAMPDTPPPSRYEAPTRATPTIEPDAASPPPTGAVPPAAHPPNQVGVFLVSTATIVTLLLLLALVAVGGWWIFAQFAGLEGPGAGPLVTRPTPTATPTLPLVASATPDESTTPGPSPTPSITGEAAPTPSGTPDQPPSPSPSPSPTGTPPPTPTESTPPAPTETAPPSATPFVAAACPQEPGPTFAAAWREVAPRLGCPTGPQTVISLIAEEAFEGGHLFWRNDTDDVYVVFDRSLETGQPLAVGAWLTDPTWQWDGSNPDGVGLTPPPGRVEPKRGFGYVWRTFLGAQEGPLGWALDQEYGFANLGQAQPFQNGLMFKASGPDLYLLFDNGSFLRR